MRLLVGENVLTGIADGFFGIFILIGLLYIPEPKRRVNGVLGGLIF
jgi:hypothetical protein